jgi:hypothetical protein
MNHDTFAAIERANYENDPRTQRYDAPGVYEALKGLVTLTLPYLELDPDTDAELIRAILGDEELARLLAADECTEIEDYEFRVPADLQVCPLCSGTGSVVDPAIDCGGISSQEFIEDPMFELEYRQGVYDIACPQCRGNNVVPGIVEPGTEDEPGTRDECWTPLRRALYAALLDWQQAEAEYQAECRAERIMGC